MSRPAPSAVQIGAATQALAQQAYARQRSISMSRPRIDLAQAIVNTWENPNPNLRCPACLHCRGAAANEKPFIHNEDCVVLVAEKILEESEQHGW